MRNTHIHTSLPGGKDDHVKPRGDNLDKLIHKGTLLHKEGAGNRVDVDLPKPGDATKQFKARAARRWQPTATHVNPYQPIAIDDSLKTTADG